MANTKRRENYTDKSGNMLIPINVEGGQYNEHFITSTKLVVIALMLAALGYIIYVSTEANSSLLGWIIRTAIWFIICSFITRFVVFEEKFYYRMYKDLEQHQITTPSIFWDIASIKDTDEGAIITYSDAKIAVIVKVDRDTITGKPRDFKETHYDAISDFYREVMVQRYSFVQMNIMEQAGKDPRLAELSKIIYKSDNPNICKLMEMEVGHIKNITHTSLYESDYFLFYTNDLTKLDTIIMDVTECIFKLLDGAYVGYRILNSKDIVDMVKDEYGVTYFNTTEASLLMYNNNENSLVKPFDITGILWTDGEEQTLNNIDKNKLRRITSGVIQESISIKNMALKESIYRKEEKNKIGIDFSSLSETTLNNDTKNIKKPNNQQNINSKNKVNLQKIDKDSNDDEEYIDL